MTFLPGSYQLFLWCSKGDRFASLFVGGSVDSSFQRAKMAAYVTSHVLVQEPYVVINADYIYGLKV